MASDNHDTTDATGDLPSGERLQKVMAAAGVASRRVSEDLIAAGRVTVNGRVVTEAGRRIDPDKDKVVVDGTAVQLDTTRRYIMLNKPVGVVSTLSDENGRPDLTQFTSEYEERLFNVGRLDVETSGLLVLTNDGEMAHVLAHPSFGVTKTYIAKVRGVVTPAVIAQLMSGVELDDGPIAADKASVVGGGAGLSRTNDSSLVEITLHSGRNRIVRRMLEAVGHPVIDLVRRQFGPLHLGTLKVGHMRNLSKVELGAILTIARDGANERVDAAPVTESDDAPIDEADVVELDLGEAEVEKEYYDEDDEEYDPSTDARDARRRQAAGQDRPASSAGGATSRRAEVRRQQAGRRDARGTGAGGGSSRDDRGGYAPRDDRGGYRGRDDRAGRGDSGSRDDRGGYRGRDDRGGSAPRDDRGGYRGRDDRGGYAPRDDRRTPGQRDERGSYGRRDERGGSAGRDDRGGYRGAAGRDDRGGYRGGAGSRDDRGGFRGRDDRGPAGARDDRGARGASGRPLSPGEERAAGYPNRDQNRDPRTGRPSGAKAGGAGRPRDRDERPGGDRRDDRGGYRGADRRDDRGGYRGGDDRSGDRGGYRGNDRRDDRGGYRGGDDRSGDRGGYRGGDRRDDRGGPSRGGDRPYKPRRDDDGRGPRGGGRA